MNAKVVNITERLNDVVAKLAPAPAGPHIERARRAFAGRFEVLKPLASNSSVERYLARDVRGETVQLKVLSARAASDDRARKLFYLEAAYASKLRHMNILATGNAEEVNGVLFSVVEHRPDAVPLGELLNRRGWLDGKIAAGIADQIASALSHAHQLGMLHLQLTPKS